MLSHYWIVALRYLRRDALYTSLNIAGLALGAAACLLIALLVRQELRYDRHHAAAEHLFRVTQEHDARTPAPLGPALVATYPGVEAQARLLPTLGDVLIRNADTRRFYESRFYWADASLFDLLTFEWVQGDPTQAVQGTGWVVLTEAMAQKYFGDANPLGEILTFDVGFTAALEVTGVIADPPPYTHVRPDFLASLATFESFGFLALTDWNARLFYTYLRLRDPANAATIAATLPGLVAQHTVQAKAQYPLQPVADIHLHSQRTHELRPPGDVGTVALFAALALLILAVAGINFVNLTTARTARRRREVGMRKVLGASRRQLVMQFLGETVLMAAVALVSAVPLLYLTLPAFNAAMGQTLTVPAGDLPLLAGALLLLLGVIALGAGLYPALVLSRLAPTASRRGTIPSQRTRFSLRHGLVVAQFALGIALIASTLVIRAQWQFLQTYSPGFAATQTLVIPARQYGHATTPLPYEALREAFAAIPGVEAVAVTGDVPGRTPQQQPFLLEGMASTADLPQTTWNLFSVDYDLVETLGLTVTAGRSFSRDAPADLDDGYLINEAAWRAAQALLGPAWDNPVGKRIDRYLRVEDTWLPAKPGRVLGVVRDFNYTSLHHRVAPLVFQLSRPARDHFVLRFAGTATRPVHIAAEQIWQQFVPERPYEGYSLNAVLAHQYRTEQRLGRLFSFFAGLCLCIAGLGLFGLAAFMAQRRTREVGIRKVLGASLGSLLLLLAGDFARLVGVAAVVGVPVAYLGLHQWLSGFAYRTALPGSAFLIAVGAALLLMLATTGYQTLRAATADPVQSLRRD